MNKKAQHTDRQLYRRLLTYVTPYWPVFVISLVALIIQALTEPLKAAILEPMVDQLFVEKDDEMMIIIPVLIFIVFFISGVASFIGNSCMHWVSNRVVMDLRQDMFSRLLELPVEYFDRHSVGSILSKYTFDVIQVKEASSNAISVIVKDTLMVVGLLAWMFYVDWLLTCIALIGTPFIFLVVYVVRKRLRRMSVLVQETMADLNHALNEVIQGLRIIRLFGGQEQENRRFSEIINHNRRFNMKLVYASAASSPVVQQVAALALAIIVYIAAQRALEDQLTIGQFGSFIAAMIMLMDPLKRLVRVNEDIQRGMAASVTVFGLLDEPGEIDQGSIKLPRLTGKIEIRDLQHRYDETEIKALDQVSLVIEAGQTAALVGASGSGKTTLASLIPRFYSQTGGSILLDGIDIHEATLGSLRDNIGFVSQDVVLFNDTIRNNIAFGKLQDYSDEDVFQAAASAHAMEFIEKLPDGMNTCVGEKGSRLSGGQRQRLALARALLKDAPILILDEATSSLDTESERLIQLALEELKQNRTCLIIAHRLSTIVSADRIFVLEGGKIIESGTHEELLQRGGAYARYYASQAPKDSVNS